MKSKVRKRDGRYVKFSSEKIKNAVLKAVEASSIELSDTKIDGLVKKIVKKTEDDFSAINKIPSVEDIQNIVEETLMKSNLPSIARNYILYRNERFKIRDKDNRLMKKYSEFDKKIQTKNRSPISELLEYGFEGAKEFYKLFILNSTHLKAYENGDIHIHNLEFFKLSFDNINIDLKKLFDKGFYLGKTYIRKPHRIGSYTYLAYKVLQTTQNELYGNQSISAFDYFMADGVRKSYEILFKENILKSSLFLDNGFNETQYNNILSENNVIPKLYNHEIDKHLSLFFNQKSIDQIYKITEKDIYDLTYQSIETFLYNLNSIDIKSGRYLPVSTINYGTDTSNEGRLVIDILLEVTKRGIGNGQIPIFPIQVFKIKKTINFEENTPNYDLYLKSIELCSKTLIPQFSFLDASYNISNKKDNSYDNEVAYIGTQRIFNNINDNQKVFGRGNIATTSINLVKIALKSSQYNNFIQELLKVADICLENLKEKYDILKSASINNFEFVVGQKLIEKRTNTNKFEKTLENFNLSIGFFGLAEAMEVLYGMDHSANNKILYKAIKTIETLKEKIDSYSKKNNLNFVLIGIEDEDIIKKFYEIDKKKNKNNQIFDYETYTKSFHISKRANKNIFEKINIESNFFKYTLGGHQINIDIKEPTKDKIYESLKYSSERDIGQVVFEGDIYYDPYCGYIGKYVKMCPRCNRFLDKNDIKKMIKKNNIINYV